MSVEEYRKNLLRRKLSSETIYLYTTGLHLVEKLIGKPINQASKEDIEKYLDSINFREPNTIATRLRTFKLYFKWLGKPEIADFPMPKNKGNTLIANDLLTEEEIIKLLSVCNKPRDKAFISLLFDSACRRQEIINLNIEDLVVESDKTGHIVVNGKTGRRDVPLSFSIPSLITWLNVHPLKDNSKAPLFCSLVHRRGNRISDTSILSFLKTNTRNAGIKKRVFCHLFRHTRLTQLDKKGLSHTAMKNFAGWSRNSTMPNVYSHFSAQDTKDLVYLADGLVKPSVKKTILEPITCCKCKTPNDKTNKFCYMCGTGLDQEAQKNFIVREVVEELVKTDPNLSKIVAQKIEALKN